VQKVDTSHGFTAHHNDITVYVALMPIHISIGCPSSIALQRAPFAALQAVRTAEFAFPAPMVKALVECQIQLPRSENYITAQADEYGECVAREVPFLRQGYIIDHPRFLQDLFENACNQPGWLDMLKNFADTVHR